MQHDRSNETRAERELRHAEHSRLMAWQRIRKALARERHHGRWHRYKPIPINLI